MKSIGTEINKDIFVIEDSRTDIITAKTIQNNYRYLDESLRFLNVKNGQIRRKISNDLEICTNLSYTNMGKNISLSVSGTGIEFEVYLDNTIIDGDDL